MAGYDNNRIARAKAIEVFANLRASVSQLDSSTWPTQESEAARQLLLDVISAVAEPTRIDALDPKGLFQAAKQLDYFAESIRRSSTTHISWPLVTYCRTAWRRVMSTSEAQAFFTVLGEYNYELEKYSENLLRTIQPLVPRSIIDEIRAKHGRIYCIKVARVESANVSLYALLGHEMGHAYWAEHESDFRTVTVEALHDIFANAFAEDSDVGVVVGQALLRATEELYCDHFGAWVIGPAAAFSCAEFMASDPTPNRWTLVVSNQYIIGYPSWVHRFISVFEAADVGQFVHEFDKASSGEGTPVKASNIQALEETLADREETVIARPEGPFTEKARNYLQKNLVDIQTAMREAIDACEARAPVARGDPISEDDVAKLVKRVDSGIIPNIVPDETTLGRPAPFNAILACATLCRTWTIHAHKESSSEKDLLQFASELDRIDRFTSRAMEVSYIQKAFNDRSKESQ